MSEPTITLYVNQIHTTSYEVKTTESAIRAALAAENVPAPETATLADIIGRGLTGYSGELVLSKLVGDASSVDDSEEWDVDDWEDGADDE